MIKKSLVAATLCTLSVSAAAEWMMTAGFENLYIDVGEVEASISMLSASAGWRYPLSRTISITPEVRYASDLGKDRIARDRYFSIDRMVTEIKLTSFYGVGVRGEYQLLPDMHLAVTTSLVKTDLSSTTFTTRGGTQSWVYNEGVDDWDGAIGLGVGYAFSNTFSVESVYERIGTADLGSVRFRFRL